ncbi:hypothetical protein [Zwartia sp.]|uniref:hypothetical protein n=1 Tax=Zwartia sp. TaxID=2978004 RepID=UPI00271C008B|nr:hypothetical protein [Zwartia sp.]MDO9025831.1 hypothetical protein [Zwartia sp.]
MRLRAASRACAWRLWVELLCSPVVEATIPRAVRPQLLPLLPLGVQRSVTAKSHEYPVSAEAAKRVEEANVSVQPTPDIEIN